jgi:ectoine hydroxylase
MMTPSQLQEIRETFDRDGFVVLPDFLDPAMTQALNAEIDAYYEPLLGGTKAIEGQRPDNFMQFECDVISWDPCIEGNPVFIKQKDNAQLAEVTAACLGEEFSAPSCLVMLATAGGKGQAWHQDCTHEDASRFNLNRLLYTHDMALENGAIVVVPGSHRAGKIPPGGNQESIPGEVVLIPTAGTLVLLSGHVYHRVTPNHTQEPRLSINFRAYPAGVTADVCNVAVYRGGTYDFARGEAITADAGAI